MTRAVGVVHAKPSMCSCILWQATRFCSRSSSNRVFFTDVWNENHFFFNCVENEVFAKERFLRKNMRFFLSMIFDPRNLPVAPFTL